MKIAIMGSGGVGGYLGARLAMDGNDVTFIARGKHLTAIQRHGLYVKGDLGDMHISNAKATDNPIDIGAVDAVFVCVKLWDTAHAARLIQPIIGKDTAVISF